jgi:hypothetical protein
MPDRLHSQGRGNPERRLRVLRGPSTLHCRIEDVSEPHTAEAAGGIIRHDSGSAVTRSAADWLCLAATPTFATMALLTGFFSGGPPDIFCSAAHDASPLSGMAAMYLLMSVFHAAPWLKLIFSSGEV